MNERNGIQRDGWWNKDKRRWVSGAANATWAAFAFLWTGQFRTDDGRTVAKKDSSAIQKNIASIIELSLQENSNEESVVSL